MNSVHHLVVLAAAALSVACAPASSQRLGSAGERLEQQSRPFVFQPGLDGVKFRSTELREVGLGPNGVAMGHWSLTFQEGVVKWRHSDVLESARYEIDPDGSITSGLGRKPDRPVRAQYDKATDRILWGGLWYERVAHDSPTTGR